MKQKRRRVGIGVLLGVVLSGFALVAASCSGDPNNPPWWSWLTTTTTAPGSTTTPWTWPTTTAWTWPTTTLPGSTTTTGLPGTTTTTQPAGTSVPNFKHVAIMVFENEDNNTIFGSGGATNAPYLNQLKNQYSYASNFYAEDHFSLDNYIAMVSGQEPVANTKNDCPNYDCVYPDTTQTIVDQVEGSGRTWKGYMDGMPSPCAHGTEGQTDPYRDYAPPKTYAQRHNPFVYFGGIVHNAARCNAHVRPYTELATDLASNNLPNYMFVTPDLCHDGHSCAFTQADAWAQQEIPKLLNNPEFRSDGVLIVTFDESSLLDSSSCCGNAKGGHIGTLVISPSWGKPAGFVSSTAENHYSMLRMLEDGWHLPGYLGHAADAQITNMSEYFTSTKH